MYVMEHAYGGSVTALTSFNSCSHLVSGSNLGHVVLWQVSKLLFLLLLLFFVFIFVCCCFYCFLFLFVCLLLLFLVFVCLFVCFYCFCFYFCLFVLFIVSYFCLFVVIVSCFIFVFCCLLVNINDCIFCIPGNCRTWWSKKPRYGFLSLFSAYHS